MPPRRRSRRAWRWARGVLVLLALVGLHAAQSGASIDLPRDLRVGHWVEVRGEFEGDGRFRVTKIELLQPQEENVLIGSVAAGDGNARGFTLFGQQVDVDDDTLFRNLERDELEGSRIKLEGYWRGPRKFSSRTIAARGEGRDRMAGRIDQIQPIDGGLEVRLMRWTLFVPKDTEVELEAPLERLGLAPARVRNEAVAVTRRRDEDDLFGRGIPLAEGLVLRGQFEVEGANEDEFDLDRTDDEDRSDLSSAARLRFVYAPEGVPWIAVAEGRYSRLWRDDEDDGQVQNSTLRLGETWLLWRDFLWSGWDVQVGRQDFDDPREWIYDQNLDALRVFGQVGGALLEVSASTVLAGGNDLEQAATNLAAVFSQEFDDGDVYLAAWSMLREFEFDEEDRLDERRWHLGARALGEFVEDHESWLDVALMRGDRSGQDLSGWAYDAGTTWEPDFLQPFYLIGGYALGSGGAVDEGEDARYRQTGLQDNNGRFGGVTSYRYYGELFDPELSNLGIATLGIGATIAHRTSLDLVWHHYRQDQLLALPFVDAELDRRPNGLDADLGWELDLIFGSRRWSDFDLEIVGGWFHPGDAFPEGDDAYLARIQLRYRF